MILSFPIGYVSRYSKKAFPISLLRIGETFNNYNGDLQKLSRKIEENGKFYAWQIYNLEGLDKGNCLYCYQENNPIAYAKSAQESRKLDARWKRKRIKILREKFAKEAKEVDQ